MRQKEIEILLIEDNESHIELIDIMVNTSDSMEAHLKCAPTFFAAEVLLAQQHFDLILSDLSLPDSDYTETLQRLKQLSGNIPIIILTSFDDWETIARIVRDGANDCIPKSQLSTSILSKSIHYCLERAKMEEQLKENEQRWKFALEGNNDGVWDWNVETNEVFFSKQWKAMLGYEEEEIGTTLLEWDQRIHPEDKEKVYEDIDRHFKGETPVYNNEHRVLCKDGSYKWILDRGKVMSWTEEGKPLRVIGTHIDIEKQKRNEVLLEEKNLELDALNKSLEEKVEERTRNLQENERHLMRSEKLASLGALVSGIAHEINTPLGICVTSSSYLKGQTSKISELLQNGELNEFSLKDYLEDCKTSTSLLLNNLNRTVQLIQSFKQVSSDQQRFDKRSFQILEYIQEIVHSLLPEIKKRKVSVTVVGRDDFLIESYPGAFAQILINLIINSLTHAYDPQEEGEIQIDAFQEDEQLHLLYSDDGQGISFENQGKIFEPFYTTKSGQGGTGLGLSIVDNLIQEKLGGSIRCESEIGQGVLFEIVIPLGQGRGLQ